MIISTAGSPAGIRSAHRDGGPVVTWIRQHPLGAFFAWFFTVGWAFSFVPVFFQTGIHPQVFVLASTFIGLLLPTVVITRIVDGPEGVRQLWDRYRLRLCGAGVDCPG